MLERVFRQTFYLHCVFIGMNLLYILVGEQVRYLNSPFDGFGGNWLQNNIPYVRAVAWIYFAVSVAASSRYSSRTFLQRQLRKRVDRGSEPESAAVMALQASHILRTAWATALAASGLVLFLAAGQRVDLYSALAASTLLLLLMMPRWRRWESEYQQLVNSVELPSGATVG